MKSLTSPVHEELAKYWVIQTTEQSFQCTTRPDCFRWNFNGHSWIPYWTSLQEAAKLKCVRKSQPLNNPRRYECCDAGLPCTWLCNCVGLCKWQTDAWTCVWIQFWFWFTNNSNYQYIPLQNVYQPTMKLKRMTS